jgi:hypothetical protein
MENVGMFYVLPFEYFYGHLVDVHILRTFCNFVIIGYIFPFLVHCAKKNLATLLGSKDLKL